MAVPAEVDSAAEDPVTEAVEGHHSPSEATVAPAPSLVAVPVAVVLAAVEVVLREAVADEVDNEHFTDKIHRQNSQSKSGDLFSPPGESSVPKPNQKTVANSPADPT